MPPNDLQDRKNGFSTAGFGIVTSLQELGHEVPFRDPSAPVTFNFCHPPYAEWGNNYNIIMPAWESTDLPEGWVDHLQEADEVWAPSPFVKDVLENHGIRVNKIYPHGVEAVWAPRLRQRDKVLRFLHVGEPAPRKGGQMALDAFREVFGDRTDVHLTIKAVGRSMAWAKDRGNGRQNPDFVYPNVTVDTRSLSVEALVTLHYQHDAMIYPSWGEGFGLIPLQAMATGMPTVCTQAWAPYWECLHQDLSLKSTPSLSLWQAIHPGKMFEPSYVDLLDIYHFLDEEFEYYARHAYRAADYVRSEYSWLNVTRTAFKEIVGKFE